MHISLVSGYSSLCSVWKEFYTQRRDFVLRACLSFSTVLVDLIKGTIPSCKTFLTVIQICVCLYMESLGCFRLSSGEEEKDTTL